MQNAKKILTLLTSTVLFSCNVSPTSINTPDNINQVESESINNDTTLKVDSIMPNGFNVKAGTVAAGKPIAGRYIVKFKNNGKSETENLNAISKAKAKKVGDIKKSMKFFLIQSDNISNTKDIESLKNNPDVEFVEQDLVRTINGEDINGFDAKVISNQSFNHNNSKTFRIAAVTRQLVSFTIGTSYFRQTFQGYTGDVFSINGTAYIIRSTCLEGPALPQGLTSSLAVCQPSAPLKAISFTLRTAYQAITYNTFVGASFSVNGQWYEVKSNCIEGPALPAGITSTLPVCAISTPTPTPTAIPTPVSTPTVIPTPVATPTMFPTPIATPTVIPTAVPTPIVTSTPVVSVPFTANDPLKGNQYIIAKTKLFEGLSISTGSNNITIAVIDTGVEASHEDLSGKVVSGFTAFNGMNPLADNNGHGTHCSGIAAANVNNGKGIVGIAPNAKIMPVQVLDASGAGSDSTVAAGIMFAADSSAQILSMSLGGAGSSLTLQNAINYALSKGKVIVAATGNKGSSEISYPAGYPGVIAVGSTNSADNRSVFSQFGNHVAVTAPGEQIFSTFRGNTYRPLDGTSMATPAVSGLAALVLGYKPNLSAAQVKSAITSGSDDLGTVGFDQYFGNGRMNVLKTLQRL